MEAETDTVEDVVVEANSVSEADPDRVIECVVMEEELSGKR